MTIETRGGARPGAGRPAVEDKRKARSFKATDAEWKAIQQAAEEAGMTASEYIRAMTIKAAE